MVARLVCNVAVDIGSYRVSLERNAEHSNAGAEVLTEQYLSMSTALSDEKSKPVQRTEKEEGTPNAMLRHHEMR